MPEFLDAHGVTVHYDVWRPEERPRGVIQIAHGIGEHAGRYRALADDLVAGGYAVAANDHRGHGRTGLGHWGGDHSRLGRLGPGGLRAAGDAIVTLTALMRDEFPGAPVILLGHSWGSLLAQRILNIHSDRYDAVILTGTAYRAPGYMNAGKLNRRWAEQGATGHEWLSRDEAVWAAFADDPLTFQADVLRLFGLADSLRLLGRPARDLPHRVPLLIVIGSDDPLGGERSVRRLGQEYVRRSGLTDVTVTIYQGARHEVFNETNRHEVVQDLLAWLNARFPAGS